MVDFKFIPGFSEKDPSSEVQGGIFNRMARINLATNRTTTYITNQFPDLLEMSPDLNANASTEAKVNYQRPNASPIPHITEQAQHLANSAFQAKVYEDNEKDRIEKDNQLRARQSVEQAFQPPQVQVFQDPHDSHTYGGMV